jgi:TetR/AcrR family transcriptional regulator, lmrAB and yxaGH operons repressor
MAHSQVSDEELLAKILQVFRTYGYEGATLTRLSDVTGLEKASLYHRFPGGKQDMVRAVVESVNEWFAENIIGPLAAKGSPADRLQFVINRLREFYRGGRNSCLLDTLSLPAVEGRLNKALRESLQAWLKAFATIAWRSGYSKSAASDRAEEAVMKIEGSLVLARVLQDTKPFERVLVQLPAILIKTGK